MGSDALYLSDEQIARRVGQQAIEWKATAAVLEKDAAFPRRDPLFNDRRYWPAVVAYLDRRNGLAGPSARKPPLEAVNGKSTRIEVAATR